MHRGSSENNSLIGDGDLAAIIEAPWTGGWAGFTDGGRGQVEGAQGRTKELPYLGELANSRQVAVMAAGQKAFDDPKLRPSRMLLVKLSKVDIGVMDL
jgi:hypothetical protein